MTKTIVVLLATTLIIGCSAPQEAGDHTQKEIEQLKQDLGYLASDELEGRATGSDGEEKAAAYIADRFEKLGLAPQGTDGWYQEFAFKPKTAAQIHGTGDSATLGMGLVQEIKGRNVIGFKDNQAENTIVIGAHFDHLGWGGSGSLHAGDSAIHNGADDNASGVGAMLLLAERLSDQNTSNNYLFMAFSGEENGLWGSNHFCDQPTIDLNTVNYMLNMDMVGRLNEEKTLAVYGVGTSPYWPDQLDNIKVDGITITVDSSGVGPSDHTSFYLEDLPVLHFFTGQHEDYHKPSDDVDKINWEGIVSVCNYIETVVTWLDDDGKLSFTKTKEEKSETPAFKVTLGVMPDYLYSDTGMRIDGVNEGRPADNAGLLKGDVVVKMGEFDVDGMQGYMECLSKFAPGDTTMVTVNREGELVDIEVIWD